MSEWTPSVGDKVMVGEHGPYEVEEVSTRGEEAYISTPAFGTTVLFSWLTPAPEPEPDEPTAPGALVRDGAGRLWARDDSREWPWGCLAPYGDDKAWAQLYRPITVVLADPAEVEQLRADLKASEAQADELQRRINKTLSLTAEPSSGGLLALLHEQARILRGES